MTYLAFYCSVCPEVNSQTNRRIVRNYLKTRMKTFLKTATSNLKKLLILVAPSLGLMISPHQAWAGAQMFTNQSNCTTSDCGGLTVGGTYLYEQQFNQALPFTVQLFSAGNECLRVTGLTQDTDLEAVLVSPDGQFWVDDDGNGNGRPRIVAQTTVKGWYTLQISRYDGKGPGSNFTLKYGRYPLSNTNCSSPTTRMNFLAPASSPKL